MKKLFCLLIVVFCSLGVFAEDFYLPLTGYAVLDKATKKRKRKKWWAFVALSVAICSL
jgi:hypothetical protein